MRHCNRCALSLEITEFKTLKTGAKSKYCISCLSKLATYRKDKRREELPTPEITPEVTQEVAPINTPVTKTPLVTSGNVIITNHKQNEMTGILNIITDFEREIARLKDENMRLQKEVEELTLLMQAGPPSDYEIEDMLTLYQSSRTLAGKTQNKSTIIPIIPR